jgi:hypothetical protein
MRTNKAVNDELTVLFAHHQPGVIAAQWRFNHQP